MANKSSQTDTTERDCFEARIPVNMIWDERLVNLQEKIGMKAVGTLFMMFLFLEKYSWIGVTESIMVGQRFGRNCSRNLISSLLHESGFFKVKEDGMIEKPIYSHAGAHTEAMTPEQSRGTIIEPNNQKVITSSKDKDADAAVALIKEVLLDQNETLWKQTLLLQSPFAELLSRHWTSAVEFFIQHAIAQAKLEGLYNESEIKRYFARYVMGNNTASLRLRCYLENLDANNPSPSAGAPSSPFCFEDPVAPDGSRSYGGRPIPPDAPPRPSATAEWNEATDEWQSP